MKLNRRDFIMGPWLSVEQPPSEGWPDAPPQSRRHLIKEPCRTPAPRKGSPKSSLTANGSARPWATTTS